MRVGYFLIFEQFYTIALAQINKKQVLNTQLRLFFA